MRIKDWPGIRNGLDWSINQKEDARAGLDLPEDVDRRLRAVGFDADTWRAGMVDLMVKNNEVFVSMTAPQAALWSRENAQLT